MGCLALLLLFLALGGIFGKYAIVIFFIFVIIGIVIANADEQKKQKIMYEKKNKKNIAHKQIIEDFKPDKIIRNDTLLNDNAIYINSLNRQIMFANIASMSTITYNFDELIECNIIEDGTTIESGGIGRALVGGVLAGGTGAIVGAATRSSKPITLSLSVHIIARKNNMPLYVIPIITDSINRTTIEYMQKKQMAEEIYANVLSIIRR